jgi:hypothetical protein
VFSGYKIHNYESLACKWLTRKLQIVSTSSLQESGRNSSLLEMIWFFTVILGRTKMVLRRT